MQRRLVFNAAGPVAGVDEAGRGPLAGPVVAGAVILCADDPIAGLADSEGPFPGSTLRAGRADIAALAGLVRCLGGPRRNRPAEHPAGDPACNAQSHYWTANPAGLC